MLTLRVKSQINMTLLDVSGENSMTTEAAKQWKAGNWCDGGKLTAKLSDLAEFLERVVLPRLDPSTNRDETMAV
jgi:hypothetical protein